MYSQDELHSVQSLVHHRLLLAILPAVGTLAAAVVIFVYGQMNRSDTLWMLTVALTILGGAWFLFLYGVYVRPVLVYRVYLHFMLKGRMRETRGVFKAFASDISNRDGLDCHAMFLNVGEKDDPEDDRLFYYDAQKAPPTIPLGTHVTVHSNDKMVSSIEIA